MDEQDASGQKPEVGGDLPDGLDSKIDEQQDVSGQKTDGAGDLPDGLESVSPESNVASPPEQLADGESNVVDESVAAPEEPPSNEISNSQDDNNVDNENTVKESEQEQEVSDANVNNEQDDVDGEGEQAKDNEEAVGESTEEPVEPMEVDEEVEKPKQNGPEQVEDERETADTEEKESADTEEKESADTEEKESADTEEAETVDTEEAPKETIQEEEKMDVDEQLPADTDVPPMEDEKDGLASAETNEIPSTTEKSSDKVDNSAEKEDKAVENNTDKDGEEDIENPQFENVPESTETSHNESQSLDPFDELLKGGDAPTEDNNKTVNNTNEYDSDDHHDATDMDTTVADDTIDLSLAEEANVADVTEGQGADEEVCLIPDTEREISEAEKLKALANKPEVPATPIPPADAASKEGEDVPITVMKGELNVDENGEVQESVTDLNSLHEDIDLGEDDAPDANDLEKEREEGELEPVQESLADNVIQEMAPINQTCVQCLEADTPCRYRYVVETVTKFLCTSTCLDNFLIANPDKYSVAIRKIFIKELLTLKRPCVKCGEEKDCYYKVTNEVDTFICGEKCLNEFIGEDKNKHIVTKKRKYLQEINEVDAQCFVCSAETKCSYEISLEGQIKNVCTVGCISMLQSKDPGIYRTRKKKVIKVKPQAPLMKLKVISNATDKYLDERHKMVAKTPEQVAAARADRDRSFLRTCAQCHAPYLGNDKNLSWETMDFCNESCLGKYQNIHGSSCANCKNDVSITSLGKYCVRFGYDIRQFCCSGCLEEFKKGLKICSYCQRDISSGFEGFLAPVGDKGQFKDFCSQFCVEKFDQMSRNPVPPPVWARCAVCSKEKLTNLEVSVDNKNSLRLCSEPCFAAFKFVNHIFPDQCRWCNKYFERKSAEAYTIYTDAATHCFCCKACMNVYISNSRHIVPCNWCKVKKYNFDMIKRTLDNGQSIMMCSLNCLTLYQVSITAVSSRRIKCDQCKRSSQAQYHLTMSDATVRNFCTYQCVMSFQGQYSKTPLMVGSGDAATKQAVPTGAPRRTLNSAPSTRSNAKPSNLKILDARSTGGLPVIASVQSLASAPPPPAPVPQPTSLAKSRSKRGIKVAPVEAPKVKPKPPPPVEPPKPPTPPPPPPPKIYNHVIIKPPPQKEVKNISTMAKPIMASKGLTCKPNMVTKESQTDSHLERKILIPIPVPIYVPAPMTMFSMPFPVPVPMPLPIPIPVFIPTTRNTANGIMKEIKKIHEKMPTDPFEAELLMMAEMVAGDKKKPDSDSDSEDEPAADDGFSPDAMDTNNAAFGEDVLQMALKMATEYEEPAVDLESAMTASTITPSSHPIGGLDDAAMHHHQMMLLEQQRAAAAGAGGGGMGRKRGRAPTVPSPAPVTTLPQPRNNKRSRRSEPVQAPPPQPEPVREPVEKPDANMCLKYTFGVNAWKQWVVTKNQEIEKSTVRRKPFKSEILQLTADELNYSLCLFVKEVRKPNGSEYAPDTIYYLVLGIQQYLFENGRIDNIFTDSYYEKFTDCLDEVARKFSVLYNDSQYIVTRVEEEHLWECKQLGAHSPHVLLSTLMFFNTKHFNLVTPEEHMQLSFSHIMKHWKRNPNQPGAAKMPGSRNVLLRFYPPQSALEANSRKKKVYEQQENEENPLRCPVKLYEFYLSKCPESVKTRNDVFYLMPERSCVPDSPVWYSTQALGKEPLSKMLHRVKMVKEINIALLTS